MDKTELIEHLVKQWIKIAERDLLTAKQGLEEVLDREPAVTGEYLPSSI
ncbi:MAG: hypothetical protein HY879_25610 [Deltaproteobacteria bacterium]|nr:hypothetical protein [Deltaproteobacteria bacterium]